MTEERTTLTIHPAVTDWGYQMLLLCAPALQHELRPVIVLQCDCRMLFPTLVKTRELQNAMTLLLLALIPLLLLALALLLLVAAGIHVVIALLV